MKAFTAIKRVLVSLACLGIVLPDVLAVAGQPRSTRPLSHQFQGADVQLVEGGTLRGKVVDDQGMSLPDIPVVLTQLDREIARTTSDREGRFEVTGLTGGVYQIRAANGTRFCRLWAPRTAPPAATDGVLVVSNSEVIRGQTLPSKLYDGWKRNRCAVMFPA
jgi:hypothetical protein